MNARQMKKNLKKQIRRLKSDNDLMRRIIADSPSMQGLYDAFNKPVNVMHTTMEFQELKAKRIVPEYMADVEGYLDHIMTATATDVLENAREYVSYDITPYCKQTEVTASIFIGRKE